MFKRALLLLSVGTFLAGNVEAQFKCGSSEMEQKMREKYPQIAINEDLMRQEIAQRLAMNQYAKTTSNDSIYYDIPIVVHIVHDYGNENISDNEIFNSVDDWNDTYNKRNADTSEVIAPFKKYIGDGRIRLRLATRDPLGNPTKGITRHSSYLTYFANDQSKLGGWPNASYLNIWIINNFGPDGPGGYSYKPATAQAIPWYDGPILLAVQYNNFRSMEHEIAHSLNIDHVWGGTNEPNVACGDDDIDDTPPTKGHDGGGCSPANLYDTTCSKGYFKVYPSMIVPGFDSLVDFPDTNNSQNIMDYTFCAKMFTQGQVHSMHDALNSNTAQRNNLWNPDNLAATGALQTRPDVPPVADFFVQRGRAQNNAPHLQRSYYMCANHAADSFVFQNSSWNDTITGVSWQFSNGAAQPTSTSAAVVENQFSEPGWVTVTLSATGNNTGTTTVSRQAVYAADQNYKISNANGIYYQEFNPEGDRDKWPIFNYYNNNFKWEINNSVGYYDKHSIQYRGYDDRGFPQNVVGLPVGDYDDFFTPAFDLSSMSSGDCNLNYMYAGTARSAFASDMTDTMEIAYSRDCGRSWEIIPNARMSKQRLANNGNYPFAYYPGWMGEWELMSINIPAAARTSSTYFRFRYRPNVSPDGASTGNNFFMDRINVSNFPLGVNTALTEEKNVIVAPNPTNGSSFVMIKGNHNTDVQVIVTDIAGRMVYNASEKAAGQFTRIEIPAAAISVKGIYMVQVINDNQKHTEKLVVY